MMRQSLKCDKLKRMGEKQKETQMKQMMDGVPQKCRKNWLNCVFRSTVYKIRAFALKTNSSDHLICV